MGVPAPRNDEDLKKDLLRRIALLERRNRSSIPQGVVVLYNGSAAPSGFELATGLPAAPAGYVYITRS